MRRGSEKPGPSEDYQMLLRGEINSKEYVRRLKATVDSRLRRERAEKAWARLRGKR